MANYTVTMATYMNAIAFYRRAMASSTSVKASYTSAKASYTSEMVIYTFEMPIYTSEIAKGGVTDKLASDGEYDYEVWYGGYVKETGSLLINEGITTDVVVRLKKI